MQYYPKHYCGVFGIFGHPNAAELTYYGLYALQHRGQESGRQADVALGGFGRPRARVIFNSFEFAVFFATITPLYFLTVLSVTFANGGDNVGVYIPMFASLTVAKLVLTVLVFTLMSIIWCGIAYYLVRHTRVGDQMRRFGDRLMPIVLIILGLLILADAF